MAGKYEQQDLESFELTKIRVLAGVYTLYNGDWYLMFN